MVNVSQTDVVGPPKIPGFARLRTGDGYRHLLDPGTVQLTHLIRDNGRNGTPGSTLCGLTRFDDRDPKTWAVTRKADIAGWGVEGGCFGPGIVQLRCDDCYRMAEQPSTAHGPILREPSAIATEGSKEKG